MKKENLERVEESAAPPKPRRKYRTLSDGDQKSRVLVVMLDGIEGHVIRWTGNCGGCTEYVDGQLAYGPLGCSECGYTGSRRQSQWVPFNYQEWLDKINVGEVGNAG